MVGGKRIQTMFLCFSHHTRPASERSCSNSEEKSHSVCSGSLGSSQYACQEMAWRRALLLMPVSVFPDVSGSSREVLSGSDPLDLLFCSFSFLCFSPTGQTSQREGRDSQIDTS